MSTFSLVTVCKGRLAHLRRTLPLMVAAGFDDVIVVDFDCPQQTAAWCRENYPNVTVVKVENEPLLNLSKARNIGAAASTCEWLCFVDADVELAEGFTPWLRKNARNGFFYRLQKSEIKNSALRDLQGFAGTFACERKAFQAIGGFDEVMVDWGMEDRDLYLRLELNNFKSKTLPPALIRRIIQHDNAERSRYFRVTDFKASHLRNQFYCAAKLKLMDVLGVRNLSVSLRSELFAEAAKTAEEQHAATKERLVRFMEEKEHKKIGLLQKLQRESRRLLVRKKK